MLPWKIFVSVILALWLACVFGLGLWPAVKAHWPMAVVMTPGSVVAGSTPLSGGTVAFPFLVLLFGEPATNARTFAFLVQGLGLSSALLFNLGRKVPLPWKLLAGSSTGAALGLILGTFWLAPYVPASIVKLLFGCLWMSFGVLTLARNSEICALTGRLTGDPVESRIGFVAGLIGGISASMIGVGVEMMVYVAMVLVFRADLKIAIPTAVSACALASVEGVLLHLKLGDMEPQAVYNWLASAPIIIFGAPTGAWVVRVLPRIRMLYFVSTLCVLQFLWMLRQTARTTSDWTFVAVTLAAALIAFVLLYRTGRRLALAA